MSHELDPFTCHKGAEIRRKLIQLISAIAGTIPSLDSKDKKAVRVSEH